MSGVVLGSFSEYVEARFAADRLIEGGVPDDAVSVTGRELTKLGKPLAQITLTAALGGALGGMWLGLAVAVAIVQSQTGRWYWPLIAGLAVVLVVALAWQFMHRNRAPIVHGLQAASYDVVVADAHADQARKLLR